MGSGYPPSFQRMAELSVQKKAQGPKSGILHSVANLTTWINWTIWIPPLHHIIMKMNEHVKGVHLSTSSSSPLIFYAAASFRHSPDISHGPLLQRGQRDERTNERQCLQIEQAQRTMSSSTMFKTRHFNSGFHILPKKVASEAPSPGPLLWTNLAENWEPWSRSKLKRLT